MNTKILVVVALVVIAVIAAGIFYIKNPISTKKVSMSPTPIASQLKAPSSITEEYTDLSGFTFKYPDDLKVQRKEEEERVYSDVVLTNTDLDGKLQVKIIESTIVSIEDWIKENKELTGISSKDVSLGGLSAREFITGNKILTVAFDQGTLFSIEVIPGAYKEYWNSVYQTVLSGFTFVNTQPVVDESSSMQQEEAVEIVEEVIE